MRKARLTDDISKLTSHIFTSIWRRLAPRDSAKPRPDVAVYIQPTVTFVSSADGPACEGASPSGVRPVVRYARTAEAHAERFARAGRRGVVLRLGLLDGPGTGHADSRANDTGESTGEGTVASRGGDRHLRRQSREAQAQSNDPSGSRGQIIQRPENNDMKNLPEWCFTHRVIVVLTWLVLLAGVNVVHTGAGSAYNDNFKLPHTDSFDAVGLLQRNTPKASGLGRRRTDRHRSHTRPGHRSRRPRSRRCPADTDRCGVTRIDGALPLSEVNGTSGLGLGFLAAAVVLFIAFGSLLAMAVPLLTTGVSLGTAIAIVGMSASCPTSST
jgi:hypothetical protein